MSSFTKKLEAFTEQRNAIGCSVEEIVSLDSEAVLPDSYKLFMLVAGKGIDDFLCGSDFLLYDLKDIREAANDLLDDAKLEPLTSNAFVLQCTKDINSFIFRRTVFTSTLKEQSVLKNSLRRLSSSLIQSLEV
ncbi:MAG: hypothetical protein COA78_02885 [Blastopirellula sp.]|nr:MAG: hypothetical protein COA78_02885 [Blastopirellula sp.]